MQIEHGGNLERAIQTYGGSRSDWIDISTGISPFTAALISIYIQIVEYFIHSSFITSLFIFSNKF